jgi:hypothetical protein
MVLFVKIKSFEKCSLDQVTTFVYVRYKFLFGTVLFKLSSHTSIDPFFLIVLLGKSIKCFSDFFCFFIISFEVCLAVVDVRFKEFLRAWGMLWLSDCYVHIFIFFWLHSCCSLFSLFILIFSSCRSPSYWLRIFTVTIFKLIVFF